MGGRTHQSWLNFLPPTTAENPGPYLLLYQSTDAAGVRYTWALLISSSLPTILAWLGLHLRALPESWPA